MKSLFLIISIVILFSSCSKEIMDPCIDSSQIGKHVMGNCLYDPVCGCDGNEYYNEGLAQNAGLTSWIKGPCKYNTLLKN